MLQQRRHKRDRPADASDRFRSSGFDRWKALVDKALKGTSFESLTSQSDEGITLDPIYAPANDRPIAMRGGGSAMGGCAAGRSS
jgi:hypothetical protein